MCGRLACGLQPEEVQNCCCYKNPEVNEFVTPFWKHVNNLGRAYKPSFNICPTEVAPVLISGCHFNADSRIIVPMVFGLIPSWANADTVSKYSTINCRIENIKTSKLYGPLLQKGQRCIVVCNGFYEWQKERKHSSKPYFIHAEQTNNVLIDDPSTWNLEFASQKNSKGLKLLRLAALFESKTNHNSKDEIFSFTIITKESSSKMSWLHLRMPAIIETEEQLQVWLDCKKFDANQALQCLSHFEHVVWYPVSMTINSTSNKDIGCIKQNSELFTTKSNNNASTSILKNWLSKRPKTIVCTEENEERLSKIKKEENS